MATIPRTSVPPVPLVRLVERLRHRLYRAYQRLAPAPVVMIDLILAGWMSQAIEAAAELGIADALAAGPLTPTTWRAGSARTPMRWTDCCGR
ncbi:MAG: hypothetical protein QOI29_1064 [Mycobacterium sp.]|nr:hypothetical protein [Mycobacterium sp.]